MAPTPATYDPRLLDTPLWYVKLTGRGMCLAELAQGAFVLLFTSAALAAEFICREEPAGDPRASTRLYSDNRAQFFSLAETAAAVGIHGGLVDLEADGHVREIIEFESLLIPDAEDPRTFSSEGHTVH